MTRSLGGGPVEQQLDIDGLEVILTRKRVRNVNLHVRRDGTVCVSASQRVPQSEIERFVRSKRDWIERARERQAAQGNRNSLDCSEGASVYLWGHKLICVWVNCDTTSTEERFEQSGNKLLIHCDAEDVEPQREMVSRHFSAWLDRQLEQRVRQVLPLWEEKVGKHSTTIRIRPMKSRWGSCNIKTGAITLNAHLVHYDPRCLDQVICHELCHLYEPSHNARFHSLMDRFYPNWREVRALLNDK